VTFFVSSRVFLSDRVIISIYYTVLYIPSIFSFFLKTNRDGSKRRRKDFLFVLKDGSAAEIFLIKTDFTVWTSFLNFYKINVSPYLSFGWGGGEGKVRDLFIRSRRRIWIVFRVPFIKRRCKAWNMVETAQKLVKVNRKLLVENDYKTGQNWLKIS
jgi:hypothetical protein